MSAADRRDRLRPALAATGVDHLLVTDPVNVRYLSGFTGSAGQVLLGGTAADDRLITDDRYEERAVREAPDLALELSRDPVGVALGQTRSHLGVEAAHVSWHAGERLRERAATVGVEVVPTTELVEVLRAVKDDREVASLAAACALTVEVLEELFADVVGVGRTERELARWLERRFVDRGADGEAFPAIVAAGPNGAVPHHAPGDRPLAVGDLLTVDCGARVDGYHADCTRTVAVGDAPDELAEVHALVERAQAAGRAAAVAGVTGGEVDAATRAVIAEAGYGERFLHGTGHGVGLQVHEAPAVAREARATLRAGTALTVEPGVYLPGTGGVRIEDTLVVTADGAPRVLTDIPRTLRVL
ncbi:aminopeptidase P family protein [Nitriliruptoraceae bacterium ZYF776]|nr:aminopeptidase P family protein [Profundirhabdus halotolerans]